MRRKKLTISLCYAAVLLTPFSGFADSKVNTLDAEETAKALGWVKKPTENLCGGYYIEPDLHPNPPGVKSDSKNVVTTIRADATDLHLDSLSYLNGHVHFVQPGRSIDSNRAVLNRDKKTREIKTIDFYDHVVAREPKKITVGDHLHILWKKDRAHYDDVIYRMGLELSKNAKMSFKAEQDQYKLSGGLIAQGQAESGDQLEKNSYVFKNANYSTCAPNHTSWHLHARDIHLDKNTGRGTAKSAVIYANVIPIAYTPFISFPIDSRRYSGLLSPVLGSDSASGAYITLPYYWNIAPNYDMTLSPTLYTKRGALLSTKNRYLTKDAYGEVDFGILPNDLVFADFKNTAPTEYATNPGLSRLEDSSDTRWYFSLKHTENFSQNLQGNIDYSHLSDDYLQQDIRLPSTPNSQFLQKASLSYFAPYWHSTLLLEGYQTLHPVTLLANSNQYTRLPDLTFSLDYPASDTSNYLLDGQVVNFYRALNPGESFPSASGQPTSGVRSHLQPGLSIPWGNSYSYLHPTLSWDFTQYDVTNQAYGYPDHINRSLPIFAMDSGLYFNRSMHFFGEDYLQTLEPRLFYLRVPYHDQYQIPVFDTNIQSFTFDQLFQTNRFNGIDRIGDANQLSFALSSRILDKDSGIEKSKFGIGRIYYGENRKVQLCNQYGCQDSTTNVGATSSTERLSPIVGFFNYALNKNWTASTNIAWDPAQHQMNNANVTIQYMPQVNHIINLGYNYIQYADTYSPPTASPTDPKNNLNQITLSTAWPITQHIDGFAAWNYNISHEHFQNYLYGVSYNACCYATRFALARTFYAVGGNGSIQFNNQFLIQFVLKGLGGVGQQKTMGSIASNIPGYQDILEQ